MNVFARRTAIGLAAAATLTLAACSSGTTTSSGSTTTPATATATAGSTNTSTGMMTSGMSSAAMSSGAMSSGAMSSTHNDADVTFAQMMIVHHQGAIEMADLAPARAASSQVKDLAVTIKAAQGPEIEQMTSWLQAWGTSAGTDMNGMPNPTSSSPDAGGMGGMNHGGMGGSDTSTSSAAMSSQMPGMMSADEMSQLTAATGAEFDKMFLQMMITHHQGAIEMADTEIAQGSNPDALTLAQSIKTSQTAEITTMQQLLQTL
jgi:uncharacterized protein (DUF305 family)